MKIGKPKTKYSDKGFTLLETLVALTVLTFAFLGPITLAFYSIRSASYSQNQTIAFYLAQEAIEFVKNRRDTNSLRQTGDWLEGLYEFCRNSNGCIIDVAFAYSDPRSIQLCSSGCPKIKYNNSTGLYGYSSGGESPFVRAIRFKKLNNQEEKIIVEVSWDERLFHRSFEFQENILDWQ